MKITRAMGAMNYEILIRRAFKCNRYGNPGADADIYRALEYAETSNIRDYEKQLNKVKKYVHKAFDEAIKRLKKRKEEKDQIHEIEQLKDQVDGVETIDEMNLLIHNGLNKFVEYSIDWENN